MNIKIVITSSIFMLLTAGCEVPQMSREQCEKEIASISESSGMLENIRDACEGTGHFELASAIDSLRSGDLEAARSWVVAGFKVSDIDVLPFYEVEFSINERSNLAERNKFIADSLVRDHPDMATGYYLLGKYYSIHGDVSDVIDNFEKARLLKGELSVYASNKSLVFVYWDVDRFGDAAFAYDAAERAFPRQTHLDRELMQIAAASNLMSGSYGRARDILGLQLKLHPESSKNDYVRNMATDLASNGFVIDGYDPD